MKRRLQDGRSLPTSSRGLASAARAERRALPPWFHAMIPLNMKANELRPFPMISNQFQSLFKKLCRRRTKGSLELPNPSVHRRGDEFRHCWQGLAGNVVRWRGGREHCPAATVLAILANQLRFFVLPFRRHVLESSITNFEENVPDT